MAKRIAARGLIAAALALLASAGAAAAGELVVGAGVEGVSNTGDVSPVVGVDVRTDPLLEAGRLGFGLLGGAQIDTEADIWLGAGAYAYVALTERLRIEGSAAPGLYLRGAGEDLGDDLLFRLQLGAAYAVAPGWRVGGYLEHQSNAGTADINPGIDSAWLRVGRAF